MMLDVIRTFSKCLSFPFRFFHLHDIHVEWLCLYVLLLTEVSRPSTLASRRLVIVLHRDLG